VEKERERSDLRRGRDGTNQRCGEGKKEREHEPPGNLVVV